MRIDAYKFGRIVIDGVEYDEDVMILPGGVRPRWWRVNGHDISLFDLGAALRDKPERMIVGIGTDSKCRVLKEVVDHCIICRIELIIKTTPEAVVEYNEVIDKSKTAAALHLTC